MELLIGCGSNREKKLAIESRRAWSGLVTLDHPDFGARHKPDVLHDLESLPLPFDDNSADEIHAYDVLEHTGRQGDWRFFFAQWSDFWRVLKPGGIFFGIVPLPSSVWAWGDPSHTRVLPQECLTFLCQPAYEQVGRLPMSDFRSVYRADFDLGHAQQVAETQALHFALGAVKPSRVKI
jgi:SAM-dependent methyltransferase